MNKAILKIFESKVEYHKQQAELPIERKLEILIKLQKIGLEIKRSTGKEITYERVWKLF